MASKHGRQTNSLDTFKQLFTFGVIALIIVIMIYCMFTYLTKHKESKIYTDPIILTNPGGAISYEIDEEDVDEDTGLKSIFDKVTGKITDN